MTTYNYMNEIFIVSSMNISTALNIEYGVGYIAILT